MPQHAKFHLLLATLVGFCVMASQTVHAGLDRWMKDLSVEAPAALDQKLSEFIFPGTHDSGTYDLVPKAACEACTGAENVTEQAGGKKSDCLDFIDELDFLDIGIPSGGLCSDIEALITDIFIPFAKAQEKSLLTQLNEGARYFDLRFFRAELADLVRSPIGYVTPGEFYIHHTVIGPSSREIIADIATFLNAPDHDREVIIIKLFHMQEGSRTRMSAASLDLIYQQMFDAFGTYMAPSSEVNGGTTVNEMLDMGYQVIVLDKVPALAPATCPSIEPCLTKAHIWPSDSYAATSFAQTGGYPEAQDWDKESELFSLMKGLGNARGNLDQLWSMNLSMGSDDNGTMTKRCFVCPLPGPKPHSLCPAINDDWDELCSLEESAEYTNSKTISALVGLPREQVGSFIGDFYTPEFTHEAIKLNKGAARVVYKIKTVRTLTATGFESKQDFYPEIRFPDSDAGWGTWGGLHLEKQDDNSISPNWTARRSVSDSTPLLQIQAQIYDEDGIELGGDDLFDIQPEFLGGPSGTQLLGRSHWLFIPVEDCVDTTLFFSGCEGSGSSSGISDDSAKITFSYQVCKWGDCPGDVLVVSEDSEITSLQIDRPVTIEPGVTYTIKGDVTIEPSGSIVNHGTLIIDGSLTSDGTIENKKADGHTGIIIVNGDLWVRELLTNGGTLANYGVVRGTDTDGYIINEAGGVIDDQYGDYGFVRVHNDGKVYANMDDWFYAGGGFRKISGANPIDYTTEYIGAPSEEYNCRAVFNGTWKAATSTCLIKGYWLREGRQVHVFEGITLKISGSAFVNEGTIVNDGVIDNSNGKLINCGAGAVLGNPPLAAVETCVETEQSVLCESEPFNGTYDQLAETPTCLVGGVTLTEELRIQPGMEWHVGFVNFGCYEILYDPPDYEPLFFQCEGGAGNPILIVEEGANLVLGTARFYGRGKIINYGNVGAGDNGDPILYGQGVVQNFGTFAPFWAIWDYNEPLFGNGTFNNRCGASTEFLVGDIDDLAARDEALKNFTWTDLWGYGQESPCAGDDTDEDGIDDLVDLFPDDPLESADRDNDGVGDNGDKFPDDPLEQSDSDEDGIGDNSDEFPNAVTQAANGGIQVTTTPLSVDSNCSLMDVTAEPLAAQAPAKTTKFVDLQATFSLRGCGVGSGAGTTAESILITIDFGVELPAGVKVFKVPGSEDWRPIPNAIVEGSTVTYVLTDNGELDDNPTLGEIDDPVTIVLAIDEIFVNGFENQTL